ncbi:MAG TPA: hypothetical protein VFO59_07545, partial [Dehalococcoidia bacterium]|nr:hypothetical protein [Dehalococcoidia bacterium]
MTLNIGLIGCGLRGRFHSRAIRAMIRLGLILRHSPILTVLKSLMEDATLGRLMAIVFRDDQFFPIQGHYGSEWRKNRDIVGSGT